MDDYQADWPEHWTVDDVLADQHARYHGRAGGGLREQECGWRECQFWDAGQHLATAGLLQRPT